MSGKENGKLLAEGHRRDTTPLYGRLLDLHRNDIYAVLSERKRIKNRYRMEALWPAYAHRIGVIFLFRFVAWPAFVFCSSLVVVSHIFLSPSTSLVATQVHGH